MVPMRCNEPKVPRPTSEIKLFDKKSRRKNLIPLNEVESNFFISLNDKFNTFNTVFLAKAPLKKVYHVMTSHHIIYSFPGINLPVFILVDQIHLQNLNFQY